MMLEWLKAILGEGDSDEIDEKISKEIGKQKKHACIPNNLAVQARFS